METIGRYVFSQSALTVLVWPRSEDEVRKSALLYSNNGGAVDCTRHIKLEISRDLITTILSRIYQENDWYSLFTTSVRL
jgi:hypothetical protein